MANSNDFIVLAKAGFTAEQITKILSDNKGSNASHDTPSPVPAPVPEPKPQPKPANENENKNENNNSGLEAKFDALMALIQQNNLSNSQQPREQTMDDVIASIINPKGSEE